jgi:hypothetical protein
MRELIVTQTGDSTRQVSYSAMARIGPPTVHGAAAAGSAYAGTRLRRPVRRPQPGRAATRTMALAWLLRPTPQVARPACLASRP